MEMDWNAIIVAVLAVASSFVSNVALTRKKSREAEIKDAEREARQDERMKSIERKLDSHNGYAEKFAESSKNMAIINERQAEQAKQLEKISKDLDYLKSYRCNV